MKRGGPNHPKTYALAETLGIRRAHAVGLLEMLFHFAAQYAPEGDIGRYSEKRIAAALDWHASPTKLIEALTATGWVDTHPGVGWVVHGWSEHADRSVVQRLKRVGKKPIQSNHIDTDKVTPQRASVGNTTVHQPVPEPVPEPVPHFADVHDRMYNLHPKKKDLPLLADALEKSSTVKPLEEIERIHALWCATEDWQKNNGRFAPSLPQWLVDRGYTQEPVSGNGAPTRKLNLYTGPCEPVEGGL